jgi:hypothetical protein
LICRFAPSSLFIYLMVACVCVFLSFLAAGAGAGSWGGAKKQTKAMEEAAAKRREERKKKAVLAPEVVAKIQRRFQSACYGTSPRAFFARSVGLSSFSRPCTFN